MQQKIAPAVTTPASRDATRQRLAKAAQPIVVTANSLRSGTVVYLAGDGRWVERLAEAAVAGGLAQLDDLEALARKSLEQCEVTSVYAFPVRVAGGLAEPLSVRERIRAAGAPTILA